MVTHFFSPDSACAPQVDMRGVKTMLQRKMDRHQVVVDTFAGVRDGARMALEQQIGQKVVVLKVRAAHVHEHVHVNPIAGSDVYAWRCVWILADLSAA